MTIRGIDVSKWEPVIDWHLVLNAGYRFAFIKADQGIGTDPKFNTHWQSAKIWGIQRGAYHFYDPVVSPEAQAEHFWALVKNDPGELPFVVDIENFTVGEFHGSEYWYRYLVRLNTLSNNHPVMIYTGYYYWLKNSKKPVAVKDITYFAGYPLWIANYNTGYPLIPSPWTTWLFWQYSETGLVQGVYDELGRQTECDLDYFYGSEEEFQELLKGEWNPPEGGNTVSTFYKAVGNITIRTGPATSYPQVISGEKYVLYGDIVETVIPLQNGFVSIANIYRNDVKMAVASPAWCGSAYLQVTNYTPPGTPSEPILPDVLYIATKADLSDVKKYTKTP